MPRHKHKELKSTADEQRDEGAKSDYCEEVKLEQIDEGAKLNSMSSVNVGNKKEALPVLNLEGVTYFTINIVKKSVAGINKSDGTTTVDDLEIASVLNNFFGFVVTNEDLSDMPSLDAKYNGNLCYQWTFRTTMFGVNCVG